MVYIITDLKLRKYKGDKKMITTVISNVTGNGAKFVATNLACVYKKKNPNKKIILIDFDQDNPTLGQVFYKESRNNSFNIIMQNLFDLKVEQDVLIKNIYKCSNGIDLLMGKEITQIDLTNNIEDGIYYKFFELIKSVYDEVIIVVNKNTNNKLNMFTLRYSEKTIIVTRNNNSNKLNIENTINIIKSYSNSKIHYIDNMFIKKSETNVSLNGCKYLGKIYYKTNQIDNKNLQKNKINTFNSNYRTFSKAINILYPITE